MVAYNINMVSMQTQFDLALSLARSNEHAIIGVVCNHLQFQALDIKLADDEAYCARTRSVQVANGASVRWLNPDPDNLTNHSGTHLTTLFVGENVHHKTVTYLQSRLRSTKFKGDYKTYYPHGHVMWEVWEQYVN